MRWGFGLVLVATVAACGSTRSPVAHIVSPGDGGGEGQAYVQTSPNQPYTVGGLVICLDRPGRATIDKVAPVDPTGGLRVDAFVATPNAFELGLLVYGADRGSIADLSTGNDPHIGVGGGVVVDHTCRPAGTVRGNGEGAWAKTLYVQYSKPTSATASDSAIAIEYTSSGSRHTLVVPWYVVLCGDDHVHPGGMCNS